MNYKYYVNRIVPPVFPKLRDLILNRKPVYNFTGNYPDWAAAKNESTGYDGDNILEKCKSSLLKIKNGEAQFERESVIFDQPEYAWPTIVSLQHVALTNANQLNIVDFGGSLGSTYFQTRKFLQNLNAMNWTIVEQENFVKCGHEYFEDENLKFAYTVKEAINISKSQCLLISGSIQYLEDPVAYLDEMFAADFEHIIIDRTSFIRGSKRLMVQTVPPGIYVASYPAWFFNENDFLKHFSEKYNLVYEFNSAVDRDEFTEDKARLYWKGFLFKRKI